MTPTIRSLRRHDEPALRALMTASLEIDAMPGFRVEDIDRAWIRMIADPEGTLLATETNGVVVGICTPDHDQLIVLPAARRRGHGRRLVAAALRLERARGRDVLQLYVPAHLRGSLAFAHAVGLRYRSSLWRFDLAADRAMPTPTFPTSVSTRAWDVAGDTDLEAWTTFMLAAFDGHPTPMSWTARVIRAVHADPSFDPASLLLVSEASAPDRLVAFARIEMVDRDRPVGARTGDVGLIGVLPAWRGRGLGRELLRWAVTTLRACGAGRVALSVEAANERGTALYRAHGFEPEIEWPHWALSVD